MKISEYEEVVAKLDAMAKESKEAEALLESLASAFFHPSARGIEHLTWSETTSGRRNADKERQLTTEEKLRAAELRLRTLVEQIPAVTFMAVLGEGENEIYVSPHVEQLLGFTQAEWLADPFLWYWQLHPDDRDLWNQEFARGVRTGGPFKAECRFIARDGHTVWVHGEARIAKDERGRPMFLQGVAFDITDAKRAQEILLNEAVHKARADEELAIARRVQTSIVPRDVRVQNLEVSATMIPADDVGGDYYDVIPTPDGAWLAVGDVSGHGLNAGLVMLMVQSATLALTSSQRTNSPREVLCAINEVLYDNIRTRLEKDDHVTFTLLRFTADGRFVFAGAHEDLIVKRAATGRVDSIRPPGTWLGARRDIRRVTVDSLLQLEDGDVMVLYTDGVTEAMNASRAQWGFERLCDRLEGFPATASVDEIRDGIVASTRAWMGDHPQEDDISVVVLRYRKTT